MLLGTVFIELSYIIQKTPFIYFYFILLVREKRIRLTICFMINASLLFN